MDRQKTSIFRIPAHYCACNPQRPALALVPLVATFTEICQSYPRLEYLFGGYFQRHLRVAQTNPGRILKQFAQTKPAIVDQTIEQLTELISLLQAGPRAEERAQDFLEALECPYYPPYYNQSTIQWLRQTRELLFIESAGLPSKTPAPAGDIPQLDCYLQLQGYKWMDVPELPLYLPSQLLGGYLPLQRPAQILINFTPLKPLTSELLDYAGQLAEAIPLVFSITPLQEVKS